MVVDLIMSAAEKQIEASATQSQDRRYRAMESSEFKRYTVSCSITLQQQSNITKVFNVSQTSYAHSMAHSSANYTDSTFHSKKHRPKTLEDSS